MGLTKGKKGWRIRERNEGVRLAKGKKRDEGLAKGKKGRRVG